MTNNDNTPHVTVVQQNNSGCSTVIKVLLGLILVGALIMGGCVMCGVSTVTVLNESIQQAKDEADEKAAEEKAAEEKAAEKVETEGEAAPAPEPILEVVEKSLDLAVIQYPATVVTTEKFELLNREGKETPISVGTIIKIERRSGLGTLTMAVGGEIYVGNESRLIGKIKLK